MLRQVYITKDGSVIFKRDFGKALDQDSFGQVFKNISKEAAKIAADQIQYHDFFKYRISYVSVPDKNILILFISDLSDKFENVKKELMRTKKEFLSMFSTILDEMIDEETFDIFDPTIESVHKNLRPKLSLVGFSGVGKTTITRLITAEDIPMEHIPTITGDIGTIKIGKLHFHLWDFAGQEQFSFLWNNFIKGSDAVLLISDSTLENCEKSKYFLELIKKEAPYAHTAVIGNKQDLPEAMPIADIERHLSMKAYSMIATDINNRDKMIQIIADVLEMSGEVSPLLKPLIDRDRKMNEAEKALEQGDFLSAANLFDEVANLSLQLGDDRVSQDLHEKAQKIKAILKKAEAQAPAPALGAIAAPAGSPPAPTLPPVKSPAVAPPAPVAPPPAPVAPPPAPVAPTPAPAAPTSASRPQAAPAAASGQVDQLSLLLAKLQNKAAPGKTPAPTPAAPSAPAPAQKVGAVPSILSPGGLQSKVASAADISVPPKPMTPIAAPPAPVAPNPVAPKTVASSAPVAPASSSVSADAEKTTTEIKIKIANINKTLLDLEMQNITGELSDADFKDKTTRLQNVKKQLEQQLRELGA